MKTCKICKNSSFLIHCDTCPNSYHIYCLNQPLKSNYLIEKTKWSCPKCMISEPKNKIEKILSWRWIKILYPEPVCPEDLLKEGETEELIDENRRMRLMFAPPIEMPARREKEFFIKWKYMSYWHCEWVY